MIWKEIDNFPDYQVSDTGEVRSTKYWGQFKRKSSEGLLQQRTYKSGYKYVNLYKEGHMYSVKIHRLVAHAFSFASVDVARMLFISAIEAVSS